MRSIIVIGFALLTVSAYGQFKNLEVGVGYAYSNPSAPMRESMERAHGVILDFYVLPEKKPVALGIEVSYNNYGQDKTRQRYTFDDGSTAPMDIIVSNDFVNVLAAGRYYFSRGKIQPYLTGKFGYSFYVTSLNIYDPDDLDHCAPVETNTLKRDGAFVGVVGAGVQFDLLPGRNPGLVLLNLAANYTSGGNVNYMNVDAPHHNHATHTSDVYMKFINNQTQVVHEHHVGNVYTSWIHLMDFRMSIAMRLSAGGR